MVTEIIGNPMRNLTDSKPLNDAELDRLGDLLENRGGDKAMNLEQLDGFFAALVVGPETVMPSEYLPEVLGGEMSNVAGFASHDEANEFFALMMRHWNTIADTLFKGDVHLPLLLEDEHGLASANDWANGFMRGMKMRSDGWSKLVNDQENGGCLIPMMMLAHEHDKDPKMRPEPISPEKREEVIALMTAGLVNAHCYFRAAREAHGQDTVTIEPRRSTPKIGRNERCPCGSGKKHKKCCGGTVEN
jgi:uncharacterized protein